MKAKNLKEIRKSYLIFIAHFSLLLITSVFCWYLSIATESNFASKIQLKRDQINSYKNQNNFLNNKIDSINTLISMFNTQMVTNEDALERKIIQLKNESLDKIENFKSNSNYDFNIYIKALEDIDNILDAKKVLQKNKADEKTSKLKLQECNDANVKLRNRK